MFLGFRLNPRVNSIFLTRFHSSQETGARQEVPTVSPPNVSNAVVSMSRVGPALHFIHFDPEESASNCLSRSHKTKGPSLSSFFRRWDFGETHTSPNSPSRSRGGSSGPPRPLDSTADCLPTDFRNVSPRQGHFYNRCVHELCVHGHAWTEYPFSLEP